jgi:cathepsin D
MNTDAKIDGQRMYDPQKSETVKYPQELLPSKRHSFRYGDGDTLEFYLLQDRIGIGNLIADLQSLGAVPPDGMKPSFRKSKAEGILGLGYPALSTELPEYTNLVLTLAKERMLKYASFSLIGPRNDPKLAAEIDKNKITQPRGSFVVGAVEKSFYQGEIAWCKSLMTERSQWIVKLDQVLINNVVVFENQLALIDTNTAYIVTSHENYRTVKEEIPGSEPILGDRMFKYPPSSLQSISFVFGGRDAPRKFRLNRQDFSLGREDHGGKACSSIVRTQGNWGFGENFWVLGGIFLDNLVTIFDYETKEIGFADIPDEEFHGEEWQKAKLSPPVL